MEHAYGLLVIQADPIQLLLFRGIPVSEYGYLKRFGAIGSQSARKANAPRSFNPTLSRDAQPLCVKLQQWRHFRWRHLCRHFRSAYAFIFVSWKSGFLHDAFWINKKQAGTKVAEKCSGYNILVSNRSEPDSSLAFQDTTYKIGRIFSHRAYKIQES